MTTAETYALLTADDPIEAMRAAAEAHGGDAAAAGMVAATWRHPRDPAARDAEADRIQALQMSARALWAEFDAAPSTEAACAVADGVL